MAEAKKQGAPQVEEEDEERRRKRRVKIPKDAKMNMTPMIDVVFLLIIFFMLVTEMAKMEIESITLPFALKSKEDPPDQPHRIIVNVTKKGDVRMMRRKKTIEQLGHELKRRADTSPRDADGLPTLSVKIRADADCEYKYVQEVMVACMKCYIWKLSFGINPVESEDRLVYQ